MGTLRDDNGNKLREFLPGTILHWDGVQEKKRWLLLTNTYYYVRLLDGEGQITTTVKAGWFHIDKVTLI